MSQIQLLKKQLSDAFAENCKKIQQKASGTQGIKLDIPILSGPSGMGKTACVEAFATDKGFKLVRLDCSYEPIAYLIGRLNNAINDIGLGRQKGCLLLVDNIDRADGEWRTILDQYAANYLDTRIRVAKTNGNGVILQPLTYYLHDIRFDEIPEQVFIVGEQRP